MGPRNSASLRRQERGGDANRGMGFWKLVWKEVEVEGRTLEKALPAVSHYKWEIPRDGGESPKNHESITYLG